MQTTDPVDNGATSSFMKGLRAAERYLGPKLHQNCGVIFAKLGKSIRILAPGAGLLPCLPVLIKAASQLGQVTNFTVICVDGADNFEALCGIYEKHFSNTSIHMTIKRGTQTWCMPLPQIAYVKVTMELHTTSIFSFLNQYRGDKFDVIVYENPPIQTATMLADKLVGGRLGANDFRQSFALLPHVAKAGTRIIITPYTVFELIDAENLLKYSLNVSIRDTSFFPLSATNVVFLPYRNTSVATVNRDRSREIDASMQNTLTSIVWSDRFAVLFLMLGVYLSIRSCSFNSLNLMTLNADMTEWFSFGVLLCNISHFAGHRVGIKGALIHMVLLATQLFCWSQQSCGETLQPPPPPPAPGFGM